MLMDEEEHSCQRQQKSGKCKIRVEVKGRQNFTEKKSKDTKRSWSKEADKARDGAETEGGACEEAVRRSMKISKQWLRPH